jgi:hypothetical protein
MLENLLSSMRSSKKTGLLSATSKVQPVILSKAGLILQEFRRVFLTRLACEKQAM